jgi:hypothetical protein
MDMINKLFEVVTWVREFEGICYGRVEQKFANVRFVWIAIREDHERLRLPYAEMIRGWTPQASRREFECDVGTLQQCFTEEEAKALMEYLFAESFEVTIKQVKLPISNTAPLGCCIGRGQGFLDLSGRKGYPLRFRAAGYYDLRHHDEIEEVA